MEWRSENTEPNVNIMITNVCLNRCEYCFAPVVTPYDRTGRARHMSIDDFIYVLGFLKRSKVNNVRLLGGEPLIHPHLGRILDEIDKAKDFELVTIFTSGLFRPRVISHLQKRNITVIVNSNHPKDYESAQYKLFLSNLELMADRGIRLVVGYNIYEQDFDWQPIIELCCNYGVDALRLCIANPSASKTVRVLNLQQQRKIGAKIHGLVVECARRGINVSFDCVLPLCVFSDKQWGSISKLYPNITIDSVCSPVIDVDPNLRVFRCFAVNDPVVSLRQFDNSQQLCRFFQEQIDSYRWHTAIDECKNCKYFVARVCQGGCLSFAYLRIAALRDRHNNSKAIFDEAYGYLRSQHLDSAISKFEQGLRLYNGDSAVICDYIFTLLKNSQLDEAQSILNCYERILSIDKLGPCFMSFLPWAVAQLLTAARIVNRTD